MRERIEERLRELRAELEVGRQMMAELDARRANLNATLLRIGGAAQALEEILRDGAGSWGAPSSEGEGEGEGDAAAARAPLAVAQV